MDIDKLTTDAIKKVLGCKGLNKFALNMLKGAVIYNVIQYDANIERTHPCISIEKDIMLVFFRIDSVNENKDGFYDFKYTMVDNDMMKEMKCNSVGELKKMVDDTAASLLKAKTVYKPLPHEEFDEGMPHYMLYNNMFGFSPASIFFNEYEALKDIMKKHEDPEKNEEYDLVITFQGIEYVSVTPFPAYESIKDDKNIIDKHNAVFQSLVDAVSKWAERNNKQRLKENEQNYISNQVYLYKTTGEFVKLTNNPSLK